MTKAEKWAGLLYSILTVGVLAWIGWNLSKVSGNLIVRPSQVLAEVRLLQGKIDTLRAEILLLRTELSK